MKLLNEQFSPVSPHTPTPLRPNSPLSTLLSNTLGINFFPENDRPSSTSTPQHNTTGNPTLLCILIPVLNTHHGRYFQLQGCNQYT